jgi:hypothetical protein
MAARSGPTSLKLRSVAGGGAARDRGARGARRGAGRPTRPPAASARAARRRGASSPTVLRARARSPTTTWPRSSTWCRTAIGAPAGKPGSTTGSPRQRRRRHGGGAGMLRDAADVLIAHASTQLLGTLDGAGAAAPGHGDDRPHPRHPRRAHHVRREGGAVGTAGRPRSCTRLRAAREAVAVMQAERRRRHVLERARSVAWRRSSGRIVSASRPVPATQVIARDRHSRAACGPAPRWGLDDAS